MMCSSVEHDTFVQTSRTMAKKAAKKAAPKKKATAKKAAKKAAPKKKATAKKAAKKK